jgi:hypothetical protein
MMQFALLCLMFSCQIEFNNFATLCFSSAEILTVQSMLNLNLNKYFIFKLRRKIFKVMLTMQEAGQAQLNLW